MDISRSRSLCAIGATLLAGVRSRAGAAGLPAIRLGVLPSDFAAQGYYAKDMGFFAKAGIDVEIVPMTSGPASAAAVVAGSLDFAYSNVLSLALAHDRGFPFQAVAVANIYRSDAPAGGLIGVKASSPIRTAKDLNGKIVAVGALNSITHLGARAWIDANGGDSTTIRYPEIQISEEPEAIMSGRVDAAVLDQGIYPTLGKPGDPIRVIAHAYDSIAPTFAIGLWFGKTDWIQSNPQPTRAFASAIATAATWANAHHHESAAILAHAMSTSVEQVDASTRYTYGLTLAPNLVQPQIDLAARYGLIKPFAAQAILRG